MEKERFQIDSILDSIKSKYHPREYELFFEKYSRHIKAINVDAVLNQKGFTPHKNVQKRKKIKTSTSQIKITCENLEEVEPEDVQKLSKIENIEPISEVLNCRMNDQKFNQNKIQLEKQSRPQNDISSKSKEEHAPQPILEISILPSSGNVIPQKKDEKDLKRTASDYEDDDSEQSEQTKKKQKHPFAVSFELPAQNSQLEFPPSQFSQRMSSSHGLNMGLSSEFLNPLSQMSVGPQFSMSNFDNYRHFEGQFGGQMYRMGPGEFGSEQNLVVDRKSLQEKRKWHLSEASRLYLEMNQHIQKASNCDQMMEMMKKMSEPRRGGGYFYPGGFMNSQY